MTRYRKTAVRLFLALAGMAGSAAAAGERYVSMGSSYAAGPGVGILDAASAGCGRSQSNYARTVARRHQLDLADVACSGATTENILLKGQHGFPAQIEAVTPDTRLVSILIGGNDIAYVGNLFGLSCRADGKTACDVKDEAQVGQLLAALPDKLDRVIDAVRRRAPDARIVMVGYLPAVPENGKACAALPLAPADAKRMHDTTVRLTQVFDTTAARKHIDIIHAASLGSGHDACTAQPYITGYHPARMPGWKDPVGYHPTQAGMDAVAAAFDKLLSK